MKGKEILPDYLNLLSSVDAEHSQDTLGKALQLAALSRQRHSVEPWVERTLSYLTESADTELTVHLITALVSASSYCSSSLRARVLDHILRLAPTQYLANGKNYYYLYHIATRCPSPTSAANDIQGASECYGAELSLDARLFQRYFDLLGSDPVEAME